MQVLLPTKTIVFMGLWLDNYSYIIDRRQKICVNMFLLGFKKMLIKKKIVKMGKLVEKMTY